MFPADDGGLIDDGGGLRDVKRQMKKKKINVFLLFLFFYICGQF